MNVHKIIQAGMTFDSQQAVESCVAEVFDLVGLVPIKLVKNPSRVVFGICSFDTPGDRSKDSLKMYTEWVVHVVKLPEADTLHRLNPKVKKRHCSKRRSVKQIMPAVLYKN